MIRGVRGLIVEKGKILLMKRVKRGKTYFVLPGGKIEEDEGEIDALIREFKEETNLDVEVGEKFWEHSKLRRNGLRRDSYYVIRSHLGDIKLGGPELQRNKPDNQYSLTWVLLGEIQTIPIRPIKLRGVIPQQFL